MSTPMDTTTLDVDVRRIGPEAAADVLRIVLAAFGARQPLDPPADALRETRDTIAAKLAAHGGLLAFHGDGPRLESYVYGLGGRDMHPEDVRAVFAGTAGPYVGLRGAPCPA